MSNIFSADALIKCYKNRRVIDDFAMRIDRGDIYGFVGENGAGKTTLIRLIAGLIFPNEGSFELFGIKNTDPQVVAARRRMGAIVEAPSLYLNMSARENLRMQSILLGAEDDQKIRDVLEIVGLGDLYEDRKAAGNFSLGMRQRLGIAMALLGDPEFLILDEPMNGLDPAGIVGIRELILKLNRERGITFLISSHILSELSLIATKYGIISKGKMIKEITAEQLHRECTRITAIASPDRDGLMALVQEQFPALRAEAYEEGVRLYGSVVLNDLLASVLERQISISNINCYETSFEDYYLSLIGGGENA